MPPSRKVVASIEARMTSSRLPGKVLADVRGKPAIARVVARLQKCALVDEIVIATTTNAADDVLVSWAF
jgi:spore coat polysaccharide biosynthesis protein SpsF